MLRRITRYLCHSFPCISPCLFLSSAPQLSLSLSLSLSLNLFLPGALCRSSSLSGSLSLSLSRARARARARSLSLFASVCVCVTWLIHHMSFVLCVHDTRKRRWSPSRSDYPERSGWCMRARTWATALL